MCILHITDIECWPDGSGDLAEGSVMESLHWLSVLALTVPRLSQSCGYLISWQIMCRAPSSWSSCSSCGSLKLLHGNRPADKSKPAHLLDYFCCAAAGRFCQAIFMPCKWILVQQIPKEKCKTSAQHLGSEQSVILPSLQPGACLCIGEAQLESGGVSGTQSHLSQSLKTGCFLWLCWESL